MYHNSRFDKTLRPLPAASPPKAGFSGMGSNFTVMSNLKSKFTKSNAHFDLDKYTNLNHKVNGILLNQRDSSLEMNRHANTLSLQHIEHGKFLGRAETVMVEKLDRATKATNF